MGINNKYINSVCCLNQLEYMVLCYTILLGIREACLLLFWQKPNLFKLRLCSEIQQIYRWDDCVFNWSWTVLQHFLTFIRMSLFSPITPCFKFFIRFSYTTLILRQDWTIFLPQYILSGCQCVLVKSILNEMMMMKWSS